jgi:hypothetical protein
MKLAIFGNVFGDFNKVKEDVDFIEAEGIFICGNVGISQETPFIDYWSGSLPIRQPVYAVTGKYEDFGLVRDIKAESLQRKFHILTPKALSVSAPSEESFTVAGLSGTYSEKYYYLDSAPPRHMMRKDLMRIPIEIDMVFLHNVPGKLGKHTGLNFDEDLFSFIEVQRPKYLFVGGYEFKKYSFFRYLQTTVLLLSSINEGYALVDTKDWSCYFNNKMGK